MTDLRGFCHQCHHAWTAHDDGTDDGDYCRVCECDGYVPGLDPIDNFDSLAHRAGVKASDFLDESDYERGRYFQGMCDAFTYAAGEARLLGARVAALRNAHDWGCDCTADDPCRIRIALDGGPSRPERDS